jgi:hypothetical protein
MRNLSMDKLWIWCGRVMESIDRLYTQSTGQSYFDLSKYLFVRIPSTTYQQLGGTYELN